MLHAHLHDLQKSKGKTTTFGDLQRCGKIIRGQQKRENNANDVTYTKRRNIIKKKHVIDLTTNNKDVITK